MSEAAIKEREVKQRWAHPGSTHDRLVKWIKIGLPMAVGVLIAVLAVAPLDRRGDVSFILDKKKVQSAQERMRVEAAHYTGTDDKGQRFEITANNAIQHSSEVPIVDIRGMSAELAAQQGPLVMGANQARYNLDTQKVAIDGPVQVSGANGYQLATRDVLVDLKGKKIASSGPVAGQMRLGQFQARQLTADLDSRTVVLDGGARLKIVQGGVR